MSYCIVLYWVTSSLPHASRLKLSMHRSNMNTQIHEGRRGYIHRGSREYTFDGANTFTLMKHKLLRYTYKWSHPAYYNVVLRWLPITSIYKMLAFKNKNVAFKNKNKTFRFVLSVAWSTWESFLWTPSCRENLEVGVIFAVTDKQYTKFGVDFQHLKD